MLSVTQSLVENDDERIRKLVEAWDRAVQAVNRNPEAYRALFLEKVPVPESVRESYTIPRFSEGGLPSRAQWDDVVRWLLDKQLIGAEPSYESSVVDGYR